MAFGFLGQLAALFGQFLFPCSSAFETWHDLLVKPLSEDWGKFVAKILKDEQKHIAQLSFGRSVCHILNIGSKRPELHFVKLTAVLVLLVADAVPHKRLHAAQQDHRQPSHSTNYEEHVHS